MTDSPMLTRDPRHAAPRVWGDPCEIAPDVFMYPAFVNTYALKTPAGLLVVDPGFGHASESVRDAVRAWTDAPLTLQGSLDEGEPAAWADLYDHLGNEVVLTATAGRALTLPPTLLLGWRWLRLRSGLAAAPVNQTAERLLVLGIRPLA